MKRIIILSLAIISSFFSLAQTNIPQLVSFSAVVRDANNQLLVNTPVSIRLTFKQGGVSGPLVYCALHQDSTNSNGFISIQLNRDVLGTGCNGAPSTAFENIPWENGGFWMEVEYQTLASSPFVNLGQLELASSFYAFAAGTAERITNFNLNGIQNGDVMVYNSANQMFEPGQSGIASVTWANVQNKPNFATVATSGSYNDLTEKPILSISNDTIYLSNGGFVKLPATSTGAMLAPTTTNQAASNLQSFSATLNGTVNANGLSSTVVFEWGLTTAYGNVANVSQSPVTGTSDVAINANLTGLQSNTTYHYRIKATNAVNIAYSNDLSFTTSLSAPQLTTTTISSILAFSATTGGNITYDGGSAVTTRGVCYSTSPTPTTANSIMASGTGSGAFVSNLNSLTPATTYYVRAYATNTVGTTYGNELTFNTQNGIITITSTTITNITSTTAASGGNITADGGSAVAARGVCWSTSPSPTTANSKTTDGAGLGTFTSNITGLTPPGTYFYVRAYATNGVGTCYGQQLSLYITLAGEVYNSVTGKVWMDRNLGATAVATSSTDAAAYGDLYQWGRLTDGHQIRTSATTSTLSTTNTPGNSFILAPSSPYDWRSPQNDNLWQGVAGVNNPCPSGYRIPTADEWNTERASWSSDNAAGAFASPLKLPVAGYRYGSDGSLNDVGSSGNYWSSTVDGANSQVLRFSSSYAYMTSGSRALGLSVRCIKD